MILIDSYGWIKYFGEGPLAASYTDFIEGTNKEQLVTPTIVIYEVYKKIESVKGEERALEAYAQISRTTIVDLTSSLSMEAADISMNSSIGIADSIILAAAKAFNAQIVTSDQHPKGLNGVKFIDK